MQAVRLKQDALLVQAVQLLALNANQAIGLTVGIVKNVLQLTV